MPFQHVAKELYRVTSTHHNRTITSAHHKRSCHVTSTRYDRTVSRKPKHITTEHCQVTSRHEFNKALLRNLLTLQQILVT